MFRRHTFHAEVLLFPFYRWELQLRDLPKVRKGVSRVKNPFYPKSLAFTPIIRTPATFWSPHQSEFAPKAYFFLLRSFSSTSFALATITSITTGLEHNSKNTLRLIPHHYAYSFSNKITKFKLRLFWAHVFWMTVSTGDCAMNLDWMLICTEYIYVSVWEGLCILIMIKAVRKSVCFPIPQFMLWKEKYDLLSNLQSTQPEFGKE